MSLCHSLSPSEPSTGLPPRVVVRELRTVFGHVEVYAEVGQYRLQHRMRTLVAWGAPEAVLSFYQDLQKEALHLKVYLDGPTRAPLDMTVTQRAIDVFH